MAPHVPQEHDIPHGLHHARKNERKHLKRHLQTISKGRGNITIRPSPLNQLPSLILFFILLFLTIATIPMYPWLLQKVPLFTLGQQELSVSIPILGILPFLILGQLAHALLNRRYVLCEDYILEVEGLISYTLRTVRLRYLHIRGLEVDMTLFQRLFNVGDLRVGGEISPEDTDIVMTGIYNPNFYKNLIKERINKKLREVTKVQVLQQATG